MSSYIVLDSIEGLDSSVFPDEYQQVEYIESTGLEYINTKIIPNQNTGFEILYTPLSDTNNSSFGSILGARKSSKMDELQLTTYSESSDYGGTLRFGNSSYTAHMTKNLKINASLKDNVFISNNYRTTLNNVEFECPCELTLFALNQNNGVIQYGKSRIYNFKLYDNDTLIRHFIPCYRKEDNVAGLYDIIENEFYTNSSGNGSFVVGNDISTGIQYKIVSYGDSQWKL